MHPGLQLQDPKGISHGGIRTPTQQLKMSSSQPTNLSISIGSGSGSGSAGGSALSTPTGKLVS